MSMSKKARKKYYEENKEKEIEKAKKWNKENKEKRKIIMKKWYDENKERLKKYRKEYNKNHREELNEYMREYRKNHKEKINKRNCEKYLSVVNKGRVFYGYNPCKLANDYYQKTNPESKRFSSLIANSKMSLETYIAMRAVFDSKEILSLMQRLYKGSIQLEEIEDMIISSGFDMKSEKFKKLIDCINKSKSEYSFYKNYNGEFK